MLFVNCSIIDIMCYLGYYDNELTQFYIFNVKKMIFFYHLSLASVIKKTDDNQLNFMPFNLY